MLFTSAPMLPTATDADVRRPAFHFTAPVGWLNDPNGLVYLDGKYHMFYQLDPNSWSGDHKYWGHAISTDLIHWHNLPIAIEPDELGDIWSGSAVIDKRNTSGLGQPGKPPMVCIYTAAGGTNEASRGKPFTQCIAYSLDGIKYTKYSGNPVVGNITPGDRDPKVFWYQPTKNWIMVLYVGDAHFALLGSKNLKSWQRLSEYTLADTDECPDLFPILLDGNRKQQKWIAWGANGNYQVGDFDGTSFHPRGGVRRSHFGNTGYAPQNFSNAPGGQTIQISWFRDANFPGCAWNQQMGFPNLLSLKTTAQGPTLSFAPFPQIKTIRGPEARAVDGFYPVASGLLDLTGEWAVPKTGTLTLTINGIEVKVDAESGKLTGLGQEAPVDLSTGRLKLRVVADRTTLEIYAQDGLVMMPLFRLPEAGEKKGVSITADAGWKGTFKVFELRP